MVSAPVYVYAPPVVSAAVMTPVVAIVVNVDGAMAEAFAVIVLAE